MDSCPSSRGSRPKLRAPLLLMSYLNPLLAYGLDRLPADAARAGVSGFIVPDLPFEECEDVRSCARGSRPGARAVRHAGDSDGANADAVRASSGFVYAVTMTGTTGKNVAVPAEVLEYFARVKRISPLPVCAGFGIRSREQVERLAPHVDGVIVGSALVEVLERGADPAAFLRGLRCRARTLRTIDSCRGAGTMSSLPLLCRYALHGDGDSDGHEMVAGRAASIEETAARQAASSGIEVPRGLDNSRRQRLCRCPSLHGPALPVRARAAPAAADVRRAALQLPLQASQGPTRRTSAPRRSRHDDRARTHGSERRRTRGRRADDKY